MGGEGGVGGAEGWMGGEHIKRTKGRYHRIIKIMFL